VVPDDVVDYISSEEEEKPHKKIPRARHVQQEDTASSRPVSPPTNSVAYTRDADKTDETERKLERYEEEEVVYGEEEEEEEEEEKEWVDEHKDKLMFKAGLTDRLRCPFSDAIKLISCLLNVTTSSYCSYPWNLGEAGWMGR